MGKKVKTKPPAKDKTRAFTITVVEYPNAELDIALNTYIGGKEVGLDTFMPDVPCPVELEPPVVYLLAEMLKVIKQNTEPME
jgi:hypothetical protein